VLDLAMRAEGPRAEAMRADGPRAEAMRADGPRAETGPDVRGMMGWLRALVLGVLIGWMVLVRPVGLILLASLGLWWWIRSRSVRYAIARIVPIVAIVALMVGAWTARNYLQFGEVITIATNGGYNFWQTNHRFADGNDTYWSIVPLDDPEYATMSSPDEFIKNREGYRYAFAYLRDHPVHLLTMMPTKLFWLYHTDTSGLYESALYAPIEQPSRLGDWIEEHQGLVEAATFRYYELLMLLGAVGIAIALVRGRADWLWPILALPLLLTFFHLFFHAKDRFHIPLDGVIALLAALAITESGRLFSRTTIFARRSARAPRGSSA
jgi:hypothetical protein